MGQRMLCVFAECVQKYAQATSSSTETDGDDDDEDDMSDDD